MDSPMNSSENPTVSGFNQIYADLIISSLLSSPELSPISIACSFDRVLDKAIASVSSDVSVQDSLVDRTLELASILLDSTKRCFRRRASIHNSTSWFLPPELTIKVFSMLDTKSLMQAAACCTMFNSCAMDRSSYAHIDLTTATKLTDSGVVCTMIHRAGKELRSIKLGRVTRLARSDSTPSVVTGPFLSPLTYNRGFLGSRLRSLRLYNIRPMNYNSLNEVFSVCSNLTDLRIVGINSPIMHLFKTLTVSCRLIENLCLETSFAGMADSENGAPLLEFVTNSQNLTYLTLICFGVTDEMALNLVESSRKLKYLNLSRSSTIHGQFLRDLGHSCKEDSTLKTLILRNCYYLLENEVVEFCNSLLKGNFKSIQHIDVSNNSGLMAFFQERSHKPNFPLEKLKEERSDITFVADFPLKRSKKSYRVCDEELRVIEKMEEKDGMINEDEDEYEEEDEEEEEEDDEDYSSGDDIMPDYY